MYFYLPRHTWAMATYLLHTTVVGTGTLPFTCVFPRRRHKYFVSQNRSDQMLVIILLVTVCLSTVSAVLLPGSTLQVRGGLSTARKELRKDFATNKMLTKLIGRTDLTAEETESIWTDMLTGIITSKI